MATKKTVTNKSAFIRSLPSDMPAKEVVAEGNAARLSPSENYVDSIRTRSNSGTSRITRGPGRPPKNASPLANENRGSGLQAEVERIVERKIRELLEAKLAALFAR